MKGTEEMVKGNVLAFNKRLLSGNFFFVRDLGHESRDVLFQHLVHCFQELRPQRLELQEVMVLKLFLKIQ